MFDTCDLLFTLPSSYNYTRVWYFAYDTTRSYEWYHTLNRVAPRIQPSGDFKTHEREMTRVRVS